LAVVAAAGLVWLTLVGPAAAPVDGEAPPRSEAPSSAAQGLEPAGPRAAGAALEPAAVAGVQDSGAQRRAASGAQPAAAEDVRVLRVRAVDAQSGAPVRGARLVKRNAGASTLSARWTAVRASEDDGWADVELAGDPDARVQALLEARGFAARDIADLAALDGEDVPLERTATLTVRVPSVDPDVSLRVVLTRGARPQRGAWTDTESRSPVDGEVHFEDVPPGIYSAAATAHPGGWVGAEMGIELRPAQEAAVTIGAEAGVTFRGEVVDVDTRQPMSGVTVQLRPESSGMFARLRTRAHPEAQTDERGRFELDGVPLGRTQVRLFLPDGTRVTRSTTVVEHQETRFITFRARGSGVLAGRLAPGLVAQALEGRDPAAAQDGAPWSFFVAPRGASDRILEAVARGRAGLGRRMRVAPDGTFELEQVPAARRLVLFALGPNGAVGQADVHPPLKVGERRAGVEVPALERSELLFEVVDASGAPIESVKYRIEERIGDSRAWTEPRTAASASGRFRVESLTPPSLRLRLSTEGSVEWTVRVHADRENRFELRRARPIQVVVQDRAGYAVSGARVIARPADAAENASRTRAQRAWATQEGLAELELDPGLAWTLVARADGFGDPAAPVAVAPELPAGALLELVLPRTEPERPATIRGRIVRAGNGAPVWGLSFTRLGGATATVDGPEFELVGVRPGPVRIEARSGGFETVRLPVDAVRPGETVDVGELRVRAASTVSVSVRDGEGRRVRGARVVLRPLSQSDGGPARAPERLVLSENDQDRGTYSRGGIVRGKWRLRVSRRGHATVTRTVRLAQGQERVRVILNQR
ncbi:MAG: hypothetical protein AAFP22_11525, partial [Planctomycetota bacterium]